MKITYLDDEVDVFHPPVESAVNQYLRNKQLDLAYELEHHPNAGEMEGIPDFVIKDKKSGKWVFVIEIKKTPNDVSSTAYWKQARGYVVNNRQEYWKPNSPPFYMVSNIETSVFFLDKPDATDQTTHECILKDGWHHCVKFGNTAETTIAEFSNVVVAKIFNYLGHGTGAGSVQPYTFAETFKEIIEQLENTRNSLAANYETIVTPDVISDPIQYGFSSKVDYETQLNSWSRLNDPGSEQPDPKKISKMVAIDCIFRIFVYEYCRGIFLRDKKHGNLQQINVESKSIEKSIVGCFADLQKIDFSQVFVRLLKFMPENMDNGARIIITKFVECVNTKMQDAIKENANEAEFVVNTIFEDENLFPLEEIQKDGKVMTEPQLSEFVTSLCFELNGKSSIPEIFDPGCGTCNFLSYSYDLIKSGNYDLSHNDILKHLHGCDSDSFLGKLGAFRLIMKSPVDVDKNTMVDVRQANFFDTPLTDLGKYDMVVMNPPYLRSDNKLWNLDKKSIEEQLKKILGRNSYMASASQPNNYFYFVELATALLKDNGVAGFILMRTFLSTENGEFLKRFLLENFEILYIVTIPSAYFFSEQTVSPCVIIARKKKSCLYTSNEVRFARILNRSFFDESYTKILNSDPKKQDRVQLKIVKQKDLKPEDNWNKLYILPLGNDYNLFAQSTTFQTLQKIFEIERGKLANEGNGSAFFFPWSNGTVKKFLQAEMDGIEKQFRALGRNRFSYMTDYILSEKDLRKQMCLAIPPGTTIADFPGLNEFIEEFETKDLGKPDKHFTRPAKWRIDGGWAWSNVQLIIPRALRECLWVGYNQFWNSRPVYFSTNCIMLRECTLTVNKLDQEKVLKFIAGYLNSSFVQIMLEAASKNHEGLRKSEVREVTEFIYIPTKSALDSNSNLVAEIAQQFESLKFDLTGEEQIPTPRFDLDLAVAELLLQIEPEFKKLGDTPKDLAIKAEKDLAKLVNARKGN